MNIYNLISIFMFEKLDPQKRAEIEKNRTLSDAKLLSGGKFDGSRASAHEYTAPPFSVVDPEHAAEYKINELGQARLEVSNRQRKEIKKEMYTDLLEKPFEEIVFKHENGESLTREDLRLLYGVEDPDVFDGTDAPSLYNRLKDTFYRSRNWAREKILKDRDCEEDLLVIFEFTRGQVAHNSSEITADTKAYLGPLEADVFRKLPEEALEHVYTAFPEGIIEYENVTVGGKSAKQLLSEMDLDRFVDTYSDGAAYRDLLESIVESPDFVIGENPEEITLIRLSLGELGFKTKEERYPGQTGLKGYYESISYTFEEICERAKTLGLELCPPDTGHAYYLKHNGEFELKSINIAMEPINNVAGGPFIFEPSGNPMGIGTECILGIRSLEDGKFISGSGDFVFRLPKKVRMSTVDEVEENSHT